MRQEGVVQGLGGSRSASCEVLASEQLAFALLQEGGKIGVVSKERYEETRRNKREEEGNLPRHEESQFALCPLVE